MKTKDEDMLLAEKRMFELVHEGVPLNDTIECAARESGDRKPEVVSPVGQQTPLRASLGDLLAAKSGRR